MSIQTSIATVFTTSELLEAILLKLDLRYLLLAQAVSRSWEQAINKSPVIQQKLFFKPINNEGDPYFNPLLQETFPAFFQLESISQVIEYLTLYNISKHFGDRQDVILRQKASWRRMLPVQPPAKITTVEHEHFCGCGAATSESAQFTEKLQCAQANGARMGIIYDIAIRLLEYDVSSTFYIEWHMFLSDTPTDKLTMWNDYSSQEEIDEEKRYREEDSPAHVDPDDLREWEVEQARILAFRPKNTITIRSMDTYCYEAKKTATGLQVRDGGAELMVFESEEPPPKEGSWSKEVRL